jgi:hypothetical protein
MAIGTASTARATRAAAPRAAGGEPAFAALDRASTASAGLFPRRLRAAGAAGLPPACARAARAACSVRICASRIARSCSRWMRSISFT